MRGGHLRRPAGVRLCACAAQLPGVPSARTHICLYLAPGSANREWHEAAHVASIPVLLPAGFVQRVEQRFQASTQVYVICAALFQSFPYGCTKALLSPGKVVYAALISSMAATGSSSDCS